MNKVSELSDDLEAVSVVLGELKRELRTHRRFISTLLHIFHGITDFRESYKVKYNLENIISYISHLKFVYFSPFIQQYQ